MADVEAKAAEDAAFLMFTADEMAICHAASAVLENIVPLSRLHTRKPADIVTTTRSRLGELGWFGLAVPERYGGSGQSAVEFALFFRELGRCCGPVDILAQSLAALAADCDELRACILSGKLGVALAVPDGDGLRVLGDPDVSLAVTVGIDGATIHDLSGLSLEIRPPLDHGTSMRVTATVPDTALTAISPASGIWQMAQLATSAMLVGLSEGTLALIVNYAGIRETFGRKIGSYQAVRHPCADMALRIEAARSQLWYAAAAMKGERSDAQAHLDAAKHLANTAAIANADWNIQLHGGIGITDEHDAHLYLKRALLLTRLYGTKTTLLHRLLHAKLED